MWMGERAGVHHNFALICYLSGVNGIMGAKYLPQHICHTYLAP
jgi:hypothetical protein